RRCRNGHVGAGSSGSGLTAEASGVRGNETLSDEQGPSWSVRRLSPCGGGSPRVQSARATPRSAHSQGDAPMKNRALAAAGVLCLLHAGCIECEQTFTLNPDGSGKVAITLVAPLSPLDQLFGVADPAGGKRPSTEEKKRRSLDKLLSTARGVDAWKDVSADYLPDGRFKFQGTAYFKDLQPIHFEGPSGTPARLVPQPDGSLRLVFNP